MLRLCCPARATRTAVVGTENVIPSHSYRRGPSEGRDARRRPAPPVLVGVPGKEKEEYYLF